MLLTGWCFAATLQLHLVTSDVLNARLQAGVVPAKDRQRVIRQLFADAGCTLEDQPVVYQGSANVICTLQGRTPATIVVGSHFDFAERGRGIVDDWSGSSLLVSLYQTLKDHPPQHTFRFIAFAAEERGLIGSSEYVAQMSPEERQQTRAFINLECLGLTPPKVWVQRSTPILLGKLIAVARSTHIPLEGVDIGGVGDDDTHSFLSKKIPVISIHSVTQDTLQVLHSDRDNLRAINMTNYYDAYRLVAFYLAYLDQQIS